MGDKLEVTTEGNNVDLQIMIKNDEESLCEQDMLKDMKAEKKI